MQPHEIDTMIARIKAGEDLSPEEELQLLKEIDDQYSALNLYLDEVKVQQLREQLEK
jgi:hypothetical protein